MGYSHSPLAEAIASLRRAFEADARSGALDAVLCALVLRLLAQFERAVTAWSLAAPTSSHPNAPRRPRRAALLPPRCERIGTLAIWWDRNRGPRAIPGHPRFSPHPHHARAPPRRASPRRHPIRHQETSRLGARRLTPSAMSERMESTGRKICALNQ